MIAPLLLLRVLPAVEAVVVVEAVSSSRVAAAEGEVLLLAALLT